MKNLKRKITMKGKKKEETNLRQREDFILHLGRRGAMVWVLENYISFNRGLYLSYF